MVRGVLAVLAVGLGGGALWLLMRDDPGAPADAPAGGESPARVERRGRDATPRADTPSATRRARPSLPVGVPAPPPDVDVAKNRRELADLVDRVEAMSADGKRLPQGEWVDTYRRGNELIDPMLRAPEVVENPTVQKDVADLAQRFRRSIVEIQPGRP